MIEIKLLKIGETAAVDLTPYLDAKSRAVLTDERERSAFERVVGDLRLTLTNLRGVMSGIFEETVPTTRWEVEVKKDGIPQWLGEIDNESIEFDYRDKWITFDVFAKTKMFWDRLRTKDLANAGGYFWAPELITYLYMTVSQFMKILDDKLDLGDGKTIETGIDTGEFSDFQLRGGKPAPAPVGNEGMAIYLDPSTKADELLKAILLHYNAEMYVDPVTRKAVMCRREAAPATYTNIDSILSQRHDIKIRWLDSERYDYIRTYRQIKFEAPVVVQLTPRYLKTPTGTPINASQILPGLHTWRLVGYTWDQQAIMVSEDLSYTLPGPTSDVTGWHVTFAETYNVPDVVKSMKLFRKDPISGQFMFVTEVGARTNLTFTDTKGDWELYAQGDAGLMPFVSSAFDVYESFTEEDGWDDPLVDYGSLIVEGKVFDARTTLRWWTGTAYEFQEDAYATFSFFARDMDSTRFREQYRDLFAIKRGATFTLKGELAVKVGQGLESYRLPNDLTPERYYVVKKITSDITIERTTTVEAFSR
jgi:hypothetical protein